MTEVETQVKPWKQFANEDVLTNILKSIDSFKRNMITTSEHLSDDDRWEIERYHDNEFCELYNEGIDELDMLAKSITHAQIPQTKTNFKHMIDEVYTSLAYAFASDSVIRIFANNHHYDGKAYYELKEQCYNLTNKIINNYMDLCYKKTIKKLTELNQQIRNEVECHHTLVELKDISAREEAFLHGERTTI